MAIIRTPVAVGVADDSVPTGPQISAKYTLTGPDGSRVVFNDANDRDYIGVMTEITGTDSAEVRESSDDMVQADGAVHGQFFYGRRPIVLTGMLLNPATADERNRRMTQLMRASNAMRSDGTLAWQLEGGYEQFVKVRRQQPLRITGAWQKQFQLSLVASDPRIYGFALKQVQVNEAPWQVYASNYGNTGMFPTFTITGPVLNPVISNFSNGGQITLNYDITAGNSLTIDALSRTVYDNTGASRYSSVDFLETEWFTMDPGVNDIRLSYDTADTGAAMTVAWRDAWL